MRILIVDDTLENLEAARKAANEFPQHEFVFTSSAREAAESLKEVNAIISDLFFPDEEHDDEGIFGEIYAKYIEKMDSPIFKRIIDYYYGKDRTRAYEKLSAAYGILIDGTIRRAVEGLLDILRRRGCHNDWERENIEKYENILRNLPAPQFPYGGALVLKAKKAQKAHCLVTDLHRHAGDYKDAVGAIDAMTLLIPLMDAGMLTVEQVQHDGAGSLAYIGADELYRIGDSERKTSPAVWTKAIHRCLGQ